MAKLRKADPGLLDVRGAVGRSLAGSLVILQGRKPLAADSVHRVRKELKRARAGLRLLRDAVGKLAYSRENLRLRDAARPLAPLRDADVLAVTLGRFLDSRKARREAAALRRGFRKSTPQEIQASIAETGNRVSQWRMPYDTWPVLRSGIGRIYRKGRRAYTAAQARGTDRSLHEVRKHVKYLGSALEILHFDKLGKRTDAIAEALGNDHDLALLRRRLGYADRELIARIERRRRKLQRRALKGARRLYRSKPRIFVESLE